MRKFCYGNVPLVVLLFVLLVGCSSGTKTVIYDDSVANKSNKGNTDDIQKPNSNPGANKPIDAKRFPLYFDY